MADYSSAFRTPSSINPGASYNSSFFKSFVSNPAYSGPNYSRAFQTPSSFSPSSQYQQSSGSGGGLAGQLEDPIKKAAYALGFRTTGGRFPTAQESGLFEEEQPEEKDYSQSELSKEFLDKIIGEILDKRRAEEEQNPILTPPGSTGPRPRSSDSIGAFGSGFNLL